MENENNLEKITVDYDDFSSYLDLTLSIDSEDSMKAFEESYEKSL